MAEARLETKKVEEPISAEIEQGGTKNAHGNDSDVSRRDRSSTLVKKAEECFFATIAEEIHDLRSNQIANIIRAIRETFRKHESQLHPLLAICPNLDIVIGHMFVLRLGVRVQEVSWTKDMQDWTEEDCRRVGRSFATIQRMVQKGENAVDAWRRHYPQLDLLLEIDGFEEFMVVIANNLLIDNQFGMMFRVSVGALSTIDAATDIYVVTTYYQSDELVSQAHAMLAMILTNLVV